ncbi:MAG: 3-isopropylmalate dehydratase small subunit [Deinococcota bacterium]
MALATINHISGTGVYIPGDDIDTDRIIPARYLKCVTFDDLAEGLFADVRFDTEGVQKDHPLNEARFEKATIMLSNSNFGCGSSREHAPQAIYRSGFRAVIAESFAEIFFGNAITLGMPCIEASRADIEMIGATLEQNPATEITIDIENERVTVGDKTINVKVKPSAKQALLEGKWDPIQELLEHDDAISQTAQTLGYVSQAVPAS